MANQKIDIINKILEACYKHNSDALFVMSLMHQYEERGNLSKKQLEGLLLKAKKVPDMPGNWMATLEAIVLKMHTREKAPATNNTPLFEKDTELGKLMEEILAKYPTHKRVIYLFAKYNKNEAITTADKAEVIRLHKLLLK